MRYINLHFTFLLTDRPTDHTTRVVTVGRIYVRSIAMRPNNNEHIYIVQNRKSSYVVVRVVMRILNMCQINGISIDL